MTHNQKDWEADMALYRLPEAAPKAPPRVPRGTARNLRRKHLQVAYAKRQEQAK